jgi:hypothetical protein
MIVLAVGLADARADPVVDALVAEAIAVPGGAAVSPSSPAPYFVGYRMRVVESLTRARAARRESSPSTTAVGAASASRSRVGAPRSTTRTSIAVRLVRGRRDRIHADRSWTPFPRPFAGDVWLRTIRDFKGRGRETTRGKKAAADRQAESRRRLRTSRQDHRNSTTRRCRRRSTPARIIELTRALSGIFLSHRRFEWSTVQGRAEWDGTSWSTRAARFVIEPRSYVEIVAAAGVRVRADDGETAVDQESWVVRDAGATSQTRPR